MNMRPLCGDAAAAVILGGQLYGPTRVLSVRRINAAAPVWRVGGSMVTARPRKKEQKGEKKISFSSFAPSTCAS